jgi:hypothetical protein
MPSFYERLGVPDGASEEQIREGYHRTLAKLVKKLRKARASGGDVGLVEGERDQVREAFEVLTDDVRRRRYDLLRRRDEDGLDGDLAKALEPALVDPTAAAAVEVVRSLTNLDVGEPFTAPESERTEPVPPPIQVPRVSMPSMPAPRPPTAVSLLSQQEREDRAEAAVAPVPEPPSIGISIVPRSPGVVIPDAPDLDGLARNLGHDGRYIAKVRASKNMDLATLSNETKIAQRYLTAIEDNAFDRLPAPVFVRGYLREIASVLSIDEAALVDGYMALYEQNRT